MKFENTKSDGMKFDYKVCFDASEIEEKIVAEVSERAKSFKMHGFRVGKVPLQIVRGSIETSVMKDVFEKLVSSACDALVQNSTYKTLASKPVYHFENQYEKDKGLELFVSLEFAPMFDLKDIEMEITKIVPNVSEQDVVARRNEFIKNSPCREKADNTYAVKNGDEVFYKAVCFENGKKIENKCFKNKIVIPYEIPKDAEFVQGFVGKKVNESFDFSPATEKQFVYKIIVKSISRAMVELSPEEFAVKSGFKDLAHLDQEIRKVLVAEIENSAFLYHKNQILEKLVSEYAFELPSGIVELELQNVVDGVKKDLEKEKASGKASPEDLAKTDDDLRKEYAEIVNKRVLLGYILSKIAKQHGIFASEKDVHDSILLEINSSHPSLSQKIVDYYSKSESAIVYKKAEIVEEKVIAYLISKAKHNEVLKTKAEIEALVAQLLAE